MLERAGRDIEEQGCSRGGSKCLTMLECSGGRNDPRVTSTGISLLVKRQAHGRTFGKFCDQKMNGFSSE